MSYVKLNRSLRDNPVAGDPHYLAIWTWLLMLAAFKPHTVILNSITIDLKPGELATSVRILADKSGTKKDKVTAILGQLEKEGMIRRRKSNKFTVITLLNWNRYQIGEPQQRRKADAKPTGEKKVKERQEEAVFPEGLDTADFRSAWDAWQMYRKESKKTLTKSTIGRQLKSLSNMGEAAAIASIEQSISNGWAGLFEPKQSADRVNGVTIDEAFLMMDCERGGRNGSV